MHRVQKFLIAMLAIPVVGLTVVTLRPPPNHGYQQEQAQFLLLALAALWFSRTTTAGAMFFYCSLALFPVGFMMEYHHEQFNSIGALVYAAVPFFGLGLIAYFTRDTRATLAYGFVMWGAAMATGAIYNDGGLAGILCILSAVATGLVLGWLDSNEQKAITLLREVRGEQKVILQNQQELANDP